MFPEQIFVDENLNNDSKKNVIKCQVITRQETVRADAKSS